MKFSITFKTPDVLDQIEADNMEPCENHRNKDEWGDKDCEACVEAEEIEQAKRNEMKVCAEEFIKYGEYVTIEFDTHEKTARAVHVSKR